MIKRILRVTRKVGEADSKWKEELIFCVCYCPDGHWWNWAPSSCSHWILNVAPGPPAMAASETPSPQALFSCITYFWVKCPHRKAWLPPCMYVHTLAAKEAGKLSYSLIGVDSERLVWLPFKIHKVGNSSNMELNVWRCSLAENMTLFVYAIANFSKWCYLFQSLTLSCVWKSIKFLFKLFLGLLKKVSEVQNYPYII